MVAILSKIHALQRYVIGLECEFQAVEVRLQGSRYRGLGLYLTDFADPRSEGCNRNDGCCFGDEVFSDGGGDGGDDDGGGS